MTASYEYSQTIETVISPRIWIVLIVWTMRVEDVSVKSGSCFTIM